MSHMLQQAVLLSPDAVARAASRLVRDRSERWMLCQPYAVRASYARHALGGGEREQMIWMLRQPDSVRASYSREVVEPATADADVVGLQTIWMLRQPDAVRESYLREVLQAP
jgi:hypothetical protein